MAYDMRASNLSQEIGDASWQSKGRYGKPAPKPTVTNKSLTTNFFIFGFLRWLASAAFCGFYYLAIRLYEGRTLSPGQKSMFDGIIVGVSLAIGLNVAAGLKEIAMHLRWWFLARRQTHVREVG